MDLYDDTITARVERDARTDRRQYEGDLGWFFDGLDDATDWEPNDYDEGDDRMDWFKNRITASTRGRGATMVGLLAQAEDLLLDVPDRLVRSMDLCCDDYRSGETIASVSIYSPDARALAATLEMNPKPMRYRNIDGDGVASDPVFGQLMVGTFVPRYWLKGF
jgi:hypothetical protein